MLTITVNRTIPAPIERVFERLTEHARYQEFRGVSESKLLQTGPEHQNGVGAVRFIQAGIIKFVEAITDYAPPSDDQQTVTGYMGYLIKETNLPIKHHGGNMEFISVNDGQATQVVWKTTITCTIPVFGGQFAKRFLGPQTKKMFGSMLKQTEAMLTAK